MAVHNLICILDCYQGFFSIRSYSISFHFVVYLSTDFDKILLSGGLMSVPVTNCVDFWWQCNSDLESSLNS